MKFLHLNFLPRSADLALLTLRLWYGLAMLMLHGRMKLAGFSSMTGTFPDPLGVGHTPSLVLVVMAEVIGSALLVFGLFTRVAALMLAIDLGVAFWIAHGHALTGSGNGELPFLFLGAFVALFFSGGGKFALDAAIGAKG